jgi:hypothetical protein
MEIAVDGWRSSVADWDAVRSVPVDALPRLTTEQREVARKLGIPEQDYARSVLAGERNRESLLAKAGRLAKLLEQRLNKAGIHGEVARVVLRTIEHRFNIELQIDGNAIPLRIDETLVDDYFDAGSWDAEERLGRILDRALAGVKQ